MLRVRDNLSAQSRCQQIKLELPNFSCKRRTGGVFDTEEEEILVCGGRLQSSLVLFFVLVVEPGCFVILMFLNYSCVHEYESGSFSFSNKLFWC